MANGAASYTTFLRTELDPITRQSYTQLETIARETYRRIGDAASQVSNTTAAAFGDRRTSTGIRAFEAQAVGTFGTIRREATATSAAVSAMQARVSSVRSTAIGSISGATPQLATNARSAAAANDNLAASNRRVAAAAEVATSATRRQAVGVKAVETETSKVSRSLNVLGSTLAVVQGPLGPVAGRIGAISAAMRELGTGTLLVAGAATALFAFAGVANTYVEVESRLRPLYASQEQVNAALRETGRIALATRTSLAPTVDLYAKLTSAGRDYNLTSRQVSRVTQTAAEAATLSGGNNASREAGLYQFSQGLSSGKLGGDELRSVLENIPELARAIAAGFKNADGSIGTTIGNLRKLGAAGELTTNTVVDALDRSASAIDAKFAKLPKTISSASTEFITKFTLLVGQVNSATGVTSTLANTISVAADNMRLLLALAGALAARFVVPKLTGFITDLRTSVALQRELAAQSRAAIGPAIGPGTASPVSFTPKGRAVNAARSDQYRAQQAADQARSQVVAEQQVIAAVDEEIATTRAAQEAGREKARAAAADARFEVAATGQRVEALRAELAQITENRLALQASVDNYARARPLVQTQQPGETAETRGAQVAAFTEAETQAKRDLAIANLRASATARQLEAAQAGEAAATETATTAVLTNTAAANASAQRGFALLGLAEQRAAATVALAGAEAEATVATTALAASEAELSLAQRALAASTSLAGVALTGLRTAGAAVLAFFGGPLTLVMTAVIGLFAYMATQSNAALDALHNFAGGQEELQRRLGLTTDKLHDQADAARDLALALAQAGVAKARQQRVDANADLASSLGTFARDIAPGIGGRLGAAYGSGQQAADARELFRLSGQLKSGQALSAAGVKRVTDLYARYPDQQRDTGFSGLIDRGLGRLKSDVPDKVLGVEASRLGLGDAQKTLDETKAELAKPRTPPKVVAPLTRQQLITQGTALGNVVVDPVEQAKRKRDEAVQRALDNNNLDDDEKKQKIADATIAYNNETAAIGRRNAAITKREAREAQAAHNKAVHEEEAAARAAASATEKLADARARYDQAPRLVDQVRNDQRFFQSQVDKQINVTDPEGNVIGRRKYTQAEADADSAKAQESLLKPFQDTTREYERQANIQALLLQGRTAEAEALGKSYELIDRTGTLEAGQYQTLVAAAEAQESINARLADRQRIVSTLSGAVDDVRQAATQFLTELPTDVGRAGTGLVKSLFQSFRQNSAKLAVDTLFGGVQKRIDDLISGKTALENATTFTATQTTRTGGIVQRFGDVVAGVTARVQGVIDGLNAGATGALEDRPAAIGGAADLTLPGVITAVTGTITRLADLKKDDGASTEDDNGDIVVTANRIAKAVTVAKAPTQAPLSQKPPTLREIYNETGKSIGDKLDSALGTKFAGKLGSHLGDALNGAAQGSFASSIASSIGVKQSQTGASIGGAIGGVLSKITPIASALGPFGAALAPVLGIAGGLIGGLFKKTIKGGVSITGTEDSSYSGSGKIADNLKGNASSVQQSLTQLADQLGATTGGFGVSIGKNGDYYHVSGSANGDVSAKHPKVDVLYEGKDEQEAVRVAVLNAIQDGAIKGISQASQRILASGQDLQRALNKALLIENIPKRLLALTDPVRAAVNDLNTEFQQIIDALNEGKGTAEQYAQAQQLYDLERAKAISEAQKSATSAIDAYLKELNEGSSSPLSKSDVYANASKDFQTAQAGFAKGDVSAEDLVAAAKAFNDAARTLEGSSQAYFNDFDTVNQVLTGAKAASAPKDTASDAPLPSSPFSSQAVQDAISGGAGAQVQATNDQTAVLGTKLDSIISALNSNGGSGIADYGNKFSSLDNLAAFRTLNA